MYRNFKTLDLKGSGYHCSVQSSLYAYISEVWHSVTRAQTEELDVIDRIVLRRNLKYNWCRMDLYADRKFTLQSLIQIRRLMYLWHILSRDKSEFKYVESTSVGDCVNI